MGEQVKKNRRANSPMGELLDNQFPHLDARAEPVTISVGTRVEQRLQEEQQ